MGDQSNRELTRWYRQHLARREVPLPLPVAEQFLIETVKQLNRE
jgi:hypothetical protein